MRRALLIALFAASGAASLVYEVAWTRALGLLLGTSAVAATAVLATFMGGLALGAAAGARLARRTRRPLRAYGALELAIAAAAVGLAFAFRALEAAPAALGAALLVLPAAAMGATFPLACAAGAGRPAAEALYAWNTLGAVGGTIAAAFALLPRLGLMRTELAAAAVSALVGVVATALGGSAEPEEASDGARGTGATGNREQETGNRELETERRPSNFIPDSQFPVPSSLFSVAGPRGLPSGTGVPIGVLLAAFLSGFAGLLYEVAYSRVLALVLGGSVYAFATMLAAFLAGIGLGSLAIGALRSRARAVAALALAFTALAAFASGFVAPELPYRFVELFFALGASPLLEATIAAALLLLPAFGLGASFAALLRAAPRGAEGSLYAANTVGGVLGAAAGGLALVPALGLSGALAAGSAAALAAAALALQSPGILSGGRAERAPSRRTAWPLAAAAIAGVVLLRPTLPPSVLATGAFGYVAGLGSAPSRAEFFSQFAPGRIDLVFARDGRTSTVTVERLPHVNTVYLKNNGKVDGSAPIDSREPSAADMATQVSLAAAPLALHARPREALVIGMGGGVTAGAALAFPLERLDLVEIEGEVLRALRETHDFDAANGRPLDDPRLRAHVEDARLFLRRAAPASYDAIISQPAEPWLTGTANLFTRELFALGRRALKPDGLFCQWVQLYGLDEEALKTLLATFRTAFPEVLVLRPRGAREILLVGGAAAFRIDADEVGARVPPVLFARAGFAGGGDLLGEIVAGRADVDAFAAGAPVNTDDAGLVEFRAPLTRWISPRRAEIAFEHLAGSPRALEAAFAPLGPAERLALAEAAASDENFAAAEAWVRSMGDGADVHRRLGDLAAARGDAAAALLEWNETLKRDPADRGALERIVRTRKHLVESR